MCYSTKSSANLTVARSEDSASKRRVAEKVSIMSFTKYGKEFVVAIVVVAFIGQLSHEDSDDLSETPFPDEMLIEAARASAHRTPTLAALAAFAVGTLFTASLLVGEPSWARMGKWCKICFSSTKTAVSNVSSSATMNRICSTVNASSIRLFHLSQQPGQGLAISSPRDPFLPTDDIASLSLADMKELFRYASKFNREEGALFFGESSIRTCVLKAAIAVGGAVSMSRGVHTTTSVARDSDSFADVDALAFVAVCRLFAEWRSLRLVPEGSPAYGMGMNLARRDLLQNCSKMEKAVHAYIAHQPQTTPQAAPTLRQLLEFEIEHNMHRHRPCLNDKSGASGFVWTLRQLRYQTNILSFMAQVPVVYPTFKAAVNAAYRTVYDPYHGFFTRKIFTASFDAAPHADQILYHMHLPLTLGGDSSDATLTQDPSIDEDDSWVQLPLDGVDQEPEPIVVQQVESRVVGRESENPLEQLGGHLAREWLKLNQFMAQCAGFQAERRPTRNAVDVRHVESKFEGKTGAHAQVREFLLFMQPLLDGMDGLVKVLNLNDPTRV